MTAYEMPISFNSGKTDQLWYYSSLVQVFSKTDTLPRIVDEFSRTVSEIERLAHKVSGK